MAAEPQLTPACELAFTVAREGAEASPAHEPPAAMRSFLYVPQLPRRALTVAQRAIDDDPEFRQRVAERATEANVGRAGWLWLHRPAGWDAELAALTGRSLFATSSWGVPTEGGGEAGVPSPSGPTLSASNGERLLLSDIERELDGLRSMVTRLAAEQEVVPSAVEQLSEELKERQDQVAELAEQLEATLAELEAQRAELAEARRHRDSLAAALEAAVEERDRNVRESAELAERLEGAAAELTEVATQRSALRAELEHLLEARNQHARRQAELLDDLGQHLTRVERERAALADELDQARAILDAAVSHAAVEDERPSLAPLVSPLSGSVEQPVIPDLVGDEVRGDEDGFGPTLAVEPVPQELAVVEPVFAQLPVDVAAEPAEDELAPVDPAPLDELPLDPGNEDASDGSSAGWAHDGDEPAGDRADLEQLLAPYLTESEPASDPGEIETGSSALAGWLQDVATGPIGADDTAGPWAGVDDTAGAWADADDTTSADDEWDRLLGASVDDVLQDEGSSSGTAGGTSVDELDWDTFVEPRREAWTNPGQAVAGGRRPVAVPAELERDAVAAARFLVAVPDVIAIIDGDAVASLGWPTLPVVDRRDALVSYLADLAGDTGAAPDVVFDGESGDEQGLPYSDTVRVRLTAPGVTAARAAAELIDTYPVDWPVVVVTDNPVLADQASQRGAATMSNVQLLDLFIAQ